MTGAKLIGFSPNKHQVNLEATLALTQVEPGDIDSQDAPGVTNFRRSLNELHEDLILVISKVAHLIKAFPLSQIHFLIKLSASEVNF